MNETFIFNICNHHLNKKHCVCFWLANVGKMDGWPWSSRFNRNGRTNVLQYLLLTPKNPFVSCKSTAKPHSELCFLMKHCFAKYVTMKSVVWRLFQNATSSSLLGSMTMQWQKQLMTRSKPSEIASYAIICWRRRGFTYWCSQHFGK